ncbi:MAG: hypothetical protein A2Y77_07470 [Planctomycetes bacterium RBG_13_62_9]|nr:MAG: hypothetical protein A2Y77_07470 [Planctomycetes bacterium RBG_13_62_9]
MNHSDIEWSLQGSAIRAGLNIVKGLSADAIDAIIEQRRKAKFKDIDDLRRRVRFRRPDLQNLIHVGACDGLGPTRPAMLNGLRFALPQEAQPMLFDIYGSRAIESLPDYDRVAKLAAELDVTGVPFTMHPAVLLPTRHMMGGSVKAEGLGDGSIASGQHHRQAALDAATRSIRYVTATRLHEFCGRKATVAGFVAAARRARTGDNRVMGFVTVEDATGLAEVSFFPDQIALYRTICSYGGPVWVTGKVTEHLSSISLDACNCGRLA